jgi:hypothetical protein
MVVLPIVDEKSAALASRCREFAGFLVRLHEVRGEEATLTSGATDPAAVLGAVAGVGVVTGAAETGTDAPAALRYVPSPQARERVAEEQDGTWPSSVATRQRKVVRKSPGAVFYFPLEGTPGADEAPLEVFITDWSPSPGACALAIHAAHPLNVGCELRNGAGFTGRYCRHPLTGDLLPIWVAPWVKPEFGTGAVLVNPAHDRVDLAFGREVGMPIRFALAPEGYDGSPETWLVPPVIKTGVAFRTGVTDGLPFEEARVAYLRTLLDRGLAKTCTDYGFGAFTIAETGADGAYEIAWDPRRATLAGAEQAGAASLKMAISPVLAAADPRVRSSSLTVVAPSTSAEADLLALRLLLAEPGLQPGFDGAPAVHMIGPVVGQTDGSDPDVLRLALLTAADRTETLSVKAQQLEAAQRFLAGHAAIAEVAATADTSVTADLAGAARQVRDLLQRHDTKQAFTQLYRLQKTVAKSSALTAGDVSVYEVLAYTLTGVPVSLSGAALAAAWQRI